MEDQTRNYHHWGVSCVGCKKPIPLYCRLSDTSDDAAWGEVVPCSDPAVFLAWCPSCGREYPYLSNEIMKYMGSEPPKSFRDHPVIERCRLQQRNTHAAHG